MRGLLIATYVANLFLSFHYFIPAYVNSTYLSLYVGERAVGFFYALAAALTLFLFLRSGSLLSRYGNTAVFLSYAVLDALAVFALAFSADKAIVLFGFLAHQALAPLILFSLDLYLEKATVSERTTGTIRGTYLTIANTTLILAPLLAAFLIEAYSERMVYGAALLFIFPVIALALTAFRGFNDPPYAAIDLGEAFRRVCRSPSLRAVYVVNFLLQFFYAWMVVYAPLLLRELGLSWSEIGLIFSIMLIPFLLFELPVGRLADTRINERRIILAGLFLLGAFTLLFGLSAGYSFVWFASILFMTRVGASFVEAASESYFFKQVDGGSASLVALFRGTRAVSYIIGPLAGAAALSFIPLQGLFVVLGGLMLLGILSARALCPEALGGKCD
ncbi:MAG TPA: MFS transporter [Candidatus Paceibacterota bacterium]|nr:MFS transporter [Candidatus Paceibacterota bacterium]